MMNRRAFFGMAAGAAAAASGLGCSRVKKTMNKMRGKSSSLNSRKVKVAAMPGHTDTADEPRQLVSES